MKDWRPPVGSRILLTGHKFYPGHTGTVLRHETFLGHPSMAVTLDNGVQPGVRSPAEFRLLEKADERRIS